MKSANFRQAFWFAAIEGVLVWTVYASVENAIAVIAQFWAIPAYEYVPVYRRSRQNINPSFCEF